MENDLKNYIDSYSWVTLDLNSFLSTRAGYNDIEFTHIGKFYTDIPEI